MGYDFESDKEYNIDRYVSMTIELNKTCYSKGEFVEGTIILKPKEGLQDPILSSPFATLYLTEYFYYTYTENEYNHAKNRSEFVTKKAEENIPLLTMPLNFSNFQNANIMNTIKIPFQVQIPLNSYPSLIFDSTSYVKHYLCIEFPSIQAKKTVVIIIKNNAHFGTNGFCSAIRLYIYSYNAPINLWEDFFYLYYSLNVFSYLQCLSSLHFHLQVKYILLLYCCFSIVHT